MNDLSEDSIINTVHQGIKKGIRTTIDSKCFGSTVILILSGIDAMAYVSMAANQVDVSRDDFVKWAERYIKFPCQEQLTGLDLYGARCSMLNNYGTASKLSREGKCRQIAYMDESQPEIRYDPTKSKELVLVSIKALANAFFDGIDKFLIDTYADKNKAALADKRFENIVHTYSYIE